MANGCEEKKLQYIPHNARTGLTTHAITADDRYVKTGLEGALNVDMSKSDSDFFQLEFDETQAKLVAFHTDNNAKMEQVKTLLTQNNTLLTQNINSTMNEIPVSAIPFNWTWATVTITYSGTNPLIQTMTFKDTGGVTVGTITRQFNTLRQVISIALS